MKIPYNILIQIKMSVRPYFKGFTLIFFFYNCRKQDCIKIEEKRKWFFFENLFHHISTFRSHNCFIYII